MFINVRECYIVALFSYYFALYIVRLSSVVYDKKLHIAMYTNLLIIVYVMIMCTKQPDCIQQDQNTYHHNHIHYVST